MYVIIFLYNNRRDHNPTKNVDELISEKRDFKDLRVEEFKYD